MLCYKQKPCHEVLCVIMWLSDTSFLSWCAILAEKAVIRWWMFLVSRYLKFLGKSENDFSHLWYELADGTTNRHRWCERVEG